ncbi:MAG: tetratricopeptide repeat protein [Bacteroidetes bacterium]|nr:tetratricopeptide repeat protein [Bacteroidota bacterium]
MKMRLIIALHIILQLIVPLFSQQDQSMNMFRLAQAFEQQGDHERALQIYSDLYGKDSTNYVYFDAFRRTNVQLKKYDIAIRLSLHRLHSTPYDFTLQANIGSLYSMSGQEQSADSVWNAEISAAVKNQMCYRAVANEQVNQRLFDKAIGTYLRGRNEIGDHFLFANELGYLYSFMMDYTNTTREYLRMLRQNEQQYEFIQSRLALIIVRQDGLKSATAVVEEELNVKSTIPLLRLLIWLYMEGNRYTEAFSVAQTIESLVNSNGQEIFAFADRIFRENEFALAATAYQQSFKNSGNASFTPAAKYGYARCIEELSLRGQSVDVTNQSNTSSQESRTTFSDAINLFADLAKEFPFTSIGGNALFRIGWIRYKQLFDLDGALQIFDSVLTVSPAGTMVPIVLSSIGEILIAQNKLSESAVKYRTMNTSSYSNQEQRTMAQFRLGEIQFFRNDFDSALVLLKPLTENLKADESNDALLLQYFITENCLQFTDALKQFSRAELLARQFKVSEALKEFQSMIDLYPAAPLADETLLKIAEYSIQLKRYADALAAYQKLLENYTESIEKDKTQFKIGELYQYYLVDTQKAIAAYEAVLEKYPFSLFVDEARKRIRQLRGDSI